MKPALVILTCWAFVILAMTSQNYSPHGYSRRDRAAMDELVASLPTRTLADRQAEALAEIWNLSGDLENAHDIFNN